MENEVDPNLCSQNNSVKISVIIPFFKGKEWLEDAIKSVLSQTYQNLEILVINDGSIEDITELESKFYKLVSFFNVTNSGAASARNIGISKSTGVYLAFLDSDDIWQNTKVENQLKFMEKNDFVWSHTDYTRFKADTSKQVYVSAALMGHIFPKCLVWNPIATPCVMVRKDVLISDNLGFEVGKKDGEDNYLWEKLGERYQLGYIPTPLSNVRMHGKNSAFQAHIQLKGRGETANRVRMKRHEFKSAFLYYYVLTVLVYCKYSYYLVQVLLRKINREPANFELIFKPLYGFAYVNFRIIRFFL